MLSRESSICSLAATTSFSSPLVITIKHGISPLWSCWKCIFIAPFLCFIRDQGIATGRGLLWWRLCVLRHICAGKPRWYVRIDCTAKAFSISAQALKTAYLRVKQRCELVPGAQSLGIAVSAVLFYQAFKMIVLVFGKGCWRTMCYNEA